MCVLLGWKSKKKVLTLIQTLKQQHTKKRIINYFSTLVTGDFQIAARTTFISVALLHSFGIDFYIMSPKCSSSSEHTSVSLKLWVITTTACLDTYYSQLQMGAHFCAWTYILFREEFGCDNSECLLSSDDCEGVDSIQQLFAQMDITLCSLQTKRHALLIGWKPISCQKWLQRFVARSRLTKINSRSKK